MPFKFFFALCTKNGSFEQFWTKKEALGL